MKNNGDIKKWKRLVPDDQEKLYQNPIVRFLFKLGHRYISKRSNQIEGRVLEIGSGIGYHIKFENLTDKRKYVALDKNKGMLDKIPYDNVQKVLGLAEKVPFPDKTFDCVIASHILEHVNDLTSSIKEIDRVLKDTGTAFVVSPCDPGFLWNTATLFTPSRRRLAKIGLNYNKIMRTEHVNTFSECVKKLGERFEIVNISYFPFILKNSNLNLIAGLTLKKRNK